MNSSESKLYGYFFDGRVALVESGQSDGAAIDEICHRSRLVGSSDISFLVCWICFVLVLFANVSYVVIASDRNYCMTVPNAVLNDA